MKKISVITVTRNAAPLLKRTIESVSSQSYDDMEYVVVDGASSDESGAIIARSAGVDRSISEPDRGIYDAMNKGAALCTGEWVIFMNAGDTFASSDTVCRLMAYADAHPEADVIYGDVIRSAASSQEGTVKIASDTLKGHRLAFCHQSVICKRKDLIAMPFDTRHRYSADFKFFKSLALKGRRFRHVRFPVARFDTSGVSTTHRAQGIADNMRVIVEVDGLIKGLPSLLHLLPTYLVCLLRGR
ncbi:MAG: glycosyltransferase [Muribaculum sp.]|nr:glycosyltransferase [Muribaculum sp.]